MLTPIPLPATATPTPTVANTPTQTPQLATATPTPTNDNRTAAAKTPIETAEDPTATTEIEIAAPPDVFTQMEQWREIARTVGLSETAVVQHIFEQHYSGLSSPNEAHSANEASAVNDTSAPDRADTLAEHDGSYLFGVLGSDCDRLLISAADDSDQIFVSKLSNTPALEVLPTIITDTKHLRSLIEGFYVHQPIRLTVDGPIKFAHAIMC